MDGGPDLAVQAVLPNVRLHGRRHPVPDRASRGHPRPNGRTTLPGPGPAPGRSDLRTAAGARPGIRRAWSPRCEPDPAALDSRHWGSSSRLSRPRIRVQSVPARSAETAGSRRYTTCPRAGPRSGPPSGQGHRLPRAPVIAARCRGDAEAGPLNAWTLVGIRTTTSNSNASRTSWATIRCARWGVERPPEDPWPSARRSTPARRGGRLDLGGGAGRTTLLGQLPWTSRAACESG